VSTSRSSASLPPLPWPCNTIPSQKPHLHLIYSISISNFYFFLESEALTLRSLFPCQKKASIQQHILTNFAYAHNTQNHHISFSTFALRLCVFTRDQPLRHYHIFLIFLDMFPYLCIFFLSNISLWYGWLYTGPPHDFPFFSPFFVYIVSFLRWIRTPSAIPLLSFLSLFDILCRRGERKEEKENNQLIDTPGMVEACRRKKEKT
jgi:hypothetical protein